MSKLEKGTPGNVEAFWVFIEIVWANKYYIHIRIRKGWDSMATTGESLDSQLVIKKWDIVAYNPGCIASRFNPVTRKTNVILSAALSRIYITKVVSFRLEMIKSPPLQSNLGGVPLKLVCVEEVEGFVIEFELKLHSNGDMGLQNRHGASNLLDEMLEFSANVVSINMVMNESICQTKRITRSTNSNQAQPAFK